MRADERADLDELMISCRERARILGAEAREIASELLTRSCLLAGAARREGPAASRLFEELSAHYGELGVRKIREAELWEQAANGDVEAVIDADLPTRAVAISKGIAHQLEPRAVVTRCAYWLPRKVLTPHIPRRRPCGQQRTRAARTGRRSHPTRAGPDDEDPDDDPSHRDASPAQHAARRLVPPSRTRRRPR